MQKVPACGLTRVLHVLFSKGYVRQTFGNPEVPLISVEILPVDGVQIQGFYIMWLCSALDWK